MNNKIVVILLLLITAGIAYAAEDWNLGSTVMALYFSGDGSNITNLNASNHTTGTLADARLAATLTGKNLTGKNIGGVIYADQYATIQDAVNATIYELIINSNYTITTSVTLKSNMYIRGFGTLTLSPTTQKLFFIPSNSKNIQIEGLTFISNGTGRNVEAIGIDVDSGSSNIWIIHNSFIDFIYTSGTPIGIRASTATINVEKNNFTSDTSCGSSFQIYLSNADNSIIKDNIFISNCAGNMIYQFSSDKLLIENNAFTQNRNWTTQAIEAIDFEGGDGGKIIKNNFNYLSIDGILVGQNPMGGNVSDLIIAENYFNHVGYLSSAKRGGISLSGFTGINVSANVYGNSFNGSNLAVRIGESDKNYYVNATISNNIISNQPASFNTYGNNYTIYVHGNELNNITNPFYSGGAVPGIISYNNVRISPFFFGKKDIAPTAYGSGDTYYNTTKNKPCYSTGSGTANWYTYADATGC